MPFAGFENFNACLTDSEMVKRYPDEETRRKVCGSLQAKAEKKEHSEHTEFRELACKLSRNYQEHEGGLLVKDVKLLASGTWTDSHMGTPLFYPPEILKKYANNWIDNSLWSRHTGGVPRSITDKIGAIFNSHYRDNAVVGDLWVHEKTQVSKDTASLIRAGLVNYVSVEHGGKERWNAAEKRYDAEEIVFGGVAVVNQGACRVCTIHNESHSWQDEPLKNIDKEEGEGAKEMTGQESAVDTKGTAEKEAELRALQAQVSESKKSDVAALEAQLEETKKNISHNLSAQLAGSNQRIAELEMENKELLRKLTEMEHDGRVKELQKKIAELSKEPVYHTRVPNTGQITAKELELDNEEFPAFTAKDFGE